MSVTKKPKIPSQPTTLIGSIAYFSMILSSSTNCVAVKICAPAISRTPIMVMAACEVAASTPTEPVASS